MDRLKKKKKYRCNYSLFPKDYSQEFADQMAAACEMLVLSSDNLFIQAQRYETKHAPKNIKHVLCQACKEVLQGVLKILLVRDDYYVRQLIEKTNSVLSLIRRVERARDDTDMVSTFKAITYAVLALKMELSKRCQDLRNKSCRDEIMIWVGVLQNSIPSLSKSSQTYLKYKTSVRAKVSRDNVMQEIIQSCTQIKQLLQSGPEDNNEDGITSFVAAVDKVIENLSEVNRGTLSPDTDSEILFLVHHGMCVAHYAWGVYKELIVASCHRILQSKFRLLELHYALKEKPNLVQIRSEYEYTCETLLDEVCDLEKHVNMTLLQLIIETFMNPLEKLSRLKHVAERKTTGQRSADPPGHTIAEFSEYTENLCQVSLLVASSSTDSSKVREIAVSVRCLESLEPDVGPAVIVLTQEPQNKAAKKHLDLLLGRWGQEVGTIVDAVDSLIDPKVFMDMSESVMALEVDAFKTMHGCSHSDVRKHFSRFMSLSERPGLLAKKLVDANSDPVYRNGLNYFITVLFERISEAETDYQELMQTKHPTSLQYDTLERRIGLVVKAVRMLKEGLDVKSHPHLLSTKRIMFRQKLLIPGTVEKTNFKGMKVELKDTILKDTQAKKVPEVKEIPATSQHTNEELFPKHLKEAYKAGTDLFVNFPEIFAEKEREGGPSAEIYEVVKKLLNASAHHDHKVFENSTRNLLSWSNHISENAQKLLIHCSEIPKVNELKNLVRRIDHLTPEIIQKGQFITAGDGQDVQDLLKDAVEWAQMINTARIIIDVTVDRWMTLTTNLRQTVETNNEFQLKIQMNTLESAQKDICHLLKKTQSLSGKYIENGVSRIEYLSQLHDDLENQTQTIKTTALSESKATNDWWKLTMACRDWSVAVTCAICELDSISDKMASVGKKRFHWFEMQAAKRNSQMVDVIEKEVDCILELVDCVVFGDNTLKMRSDELVVQLQSSLTDLLNIAKLPARATGASSDDLFSRLKLRLAQSIWIDKAVDVRDMIRNNCFEYFGFTYQILLSAQEHSVNEALLDVDEVKERHELCGQFLDNSHQLKQKVLEVIQLCPDLSGRAVVRSTLDTISRMTSQIETLLRTSPKLTDADVNSLSEQWAARIKKLIVSLRRMDGVESSVVSEIERLNKSSSGLHEYDCLQQKNVKRPQQHYLPGQQQQYTRQEEQQQNLQEQYIRQEQHQKHMRQEQQQLHDQILSHSQHVPPLYEQGNQYSHPAHHQVQPLPHNVYTTPITSSSTPTQTTSNMMMSDTKMHSRITYDDPFISSQESSVQVVLKDAKYINYRLRKWRENDNDSEACQGPKVIQSALEMAHLCSEIALYTKGQGSLKDSRELIGAAMAIVVHSSNLETFSRRLLSLAKNDRCVDNLQACVTRLSTCTSQLQIISTALDNSARSYQGDHILMRNALNLLMTVRQMFSLAETLAAKRIQEPPSSDEVTKDVLSVLRKMQSENERYIRNEREAAVINDLGLRRMEFHDPPTLTSLVNLKLSNPHFIG